MAKHLTQPTRIKSVGTKEKIIDEFIGRVNSSNTDISIARMQSPPGWTEPAQTPQFDEYTLVLKGVLHVDTKDRHYVVKANEVFIAQAGETVQYSTPDKPGAEYVAVCIPAFSPDTVNRQG
jgi:ethanolamine utilization protein EutQ (cupin superfamily)